MEDDYDFEGTEELMRLAQQMLNKHKMEKSKTIGDSRLASAEAEREYFHFHTL